MVQLIDRIISKRLLVVNVEQTYVKIVHVRSTKYFIKTSNYLSVEEEERKKNEQPSR
jgi:hypothetical protein